MGFQKFFEYLGARLKAQWSWGSVATSGDIFLAVWEADMDRAKNRVLVFDSEPDRSHGLPERASHLQLIRSEHRRVFCVVRPGNWNDRRRESYSEDTLLVIGGKLIREEGRDGYVWLEDAGRIAARDVRSVRVVDPGIRTTPDRVLH